VSYPIEQEAGERVTLWDPAYGVGVAYVGQVWSHAAALKMDSGVRPPWGLPDDGRPPWGWGQSDIELGPFTELVHALLHLYTHTNHTTGRRQLLAVLPESIVLLERAGVTPLRTEPAPEVYLLADEAAGLMPR
jgi:hypothetical protein